ncbi:hypothetical protein ACJX0J_025986, partial [Zea mays]
GIILYIITYLKFLALYMTSYLEFYLATLVLLGKVLWDLSFIVSVGKIILTDLLAGELSSYSLEILGKNLYQVIIIFVNVALAMLLFFLLREVNLSISGDCPISVFFSLEITRFDEAGVLDEWNGVGDKLPVLLAVLTLFTGLRCCCCLAILPTKCHSSIA